MWTSSADRQNQTCPKLPAVRKFCMFVTVPVVREPAVTPTFRVLSEGSNLSLPQRNMFKLEVPSSMPRSEYEAVPVFKIYQKCSLVCLG